MVDWRNSSSLNTGSSEASGSLPYNIPIRVPLLIYMDRLLTHSTLTQGDVSTGVPSVKRYTADKKNPSFPLYGQWIPKANLGMFLLPTNFRGLLSLSRLVRLRNLWLFDHLRRHTAELIEPPTSSGNASKQRRWSPRQAWACVGLSTGNPGPNTCRNDLIFIPAALERT